MRNGKRSDRWKRWDLKFKRLKMGFIFKIDELNIIMIFLRSESRKGQFL